jgi:hypothetical protein
MVDLHGHEAGNDERSQTKPTNLHFLLSRDRVTAEKLKSFLTSPTRSKLTAQSSMTAAAAQSYPA